MLRLNKVSRTYHETGFSTPALDGVSFDVGAGEFIAITGPSGCGKSTLLNILGLLDSPDEGEVILDGADVTRVPETILARLRREKVGFIFQGFNLIDDLTVAENIQVGLIYRRISAAERRKRTEVALARLELSHRADYLPRHLSGGQQQRVAIARALVGEPVLILADEPTGNLDTASGGAVMTLLASIAREGTTVVMATHSRAHAAIASRVVRMLDGRVVSDSRLGI